MKSKMKKVRSYIGSKISLIFLLIGFGLYGQKPIVDYTQYTPQGAPSSPVEGILYGDDTANTIYYYNGSIWLDLGAAGGGSSVWGGITGTLSNQLDLQTELDAKQDNVSAGSGISIATNTISVDTGDAIFGNFDKDVSDDFSGSWNDLTDVPAGFADGADDTSPESFERFLKTNVRIATTANITLSGTQLIDGNNLQVDDRVLVKDQTDQSENGIYVVSSGSWTRALDATGATLARALVYVQGGSLNFNKFYQTDATIATSVGTDPITWTEVDLYSTGGGSGIASLADDPSPQLSSFLDAQSNQILNAGSILNNGNYIGTHNPDTNFGPGVGNGAFNFFDGGIRFGNGSSTANFKIEYSALTTTATLTLTDSGANYNGTDLGGIQSPIAGRTGTAISAVMQQTQAQLTSDGEPSAGEIVFCTDCSPMDVQASSTLEVDGYRGYDDRASDAATFTFSNLKAGASVLIEINRATDATYSGVTVAHTTGTFAANTRQLVTIYVLPSGDVLRDYKDLE